MSARWGSCNYTYPKGGGVGVIGVALALRIPLLSFPRPALTPSVGELDPLPCVGLVRSELFGDLRSW